MRAERSARVFQRRNNSRHTQIAIIRRFCSKLSSISLPFEIYRRLNDPFTAFYMQNVVQRVPASKQAHTNANRNHWSILTKITRYISQVSDISTFERFFHCIMRAERSALVIQCRNKPTQTAIIRRF